MKPKRQLTAREKADPRVTVRWSRENGELYEHRSRVTDVVECPRCGKEVECEGETEEWHQKRSRWHHTLYGPGRGECCGQVIVVSYDGCHVLDMAEMGRR